MAKPYINKIVPFDGNKEYEISISWTGNRSHANRIIIYDNETNDIVFDDLVSTFSLKHTIPAYTLNNGKAWVIQAQTFDEENISSALSDKVLFYTFETPTFHFSNLPENSKITNASLAASVYYYSSDWENISSYVFYLYDSTKKQLLESSTLNDDVNISYIYRGLENNTDYYIRCVGRTVNNMPLDTGYVLVNVRYENPNTYARIYSTPRPEQGCVHVATNLIIVQYNGTDSFEYEDGMIYLKDKTLYYDEGFEIQNNSTFILRGMNLWQNANLLKSKNKNSEYELCLSSHIYANGQLRFRLTVQNGVGTYLIYSSPQVFENEDMITIAIRRKNNIYQLEVFIELNYSKEGNTWYGTQRPINGLSNYDIWIDSPGSTYMVDKDTVMTYIQNDEPVNAKLYDVWIGG